MQALHAANNRLMRSCRRGQLAARPAAAVRRPCAHVTAFKPAYFPPRRASDAGAAATPQSPALDVAAEAFTVSLPLDYYRCLGLPRAAGSHAVRAALEAALDRPPEVGYSADTLAVRAVLLRSAAACLLDLHSRKGYDAMGSSVAGYTVEVSTQYLPGALVLLQESGLNELAIQLGTAWLASNAHDVAAGDVATAMALGHHDLAAQALVADATHVSGACQHLEAAALLLRRARRPPSEAALLAQLQQEVMQTLEEYSPQYCLELLALPLAAAARQRGCLLVRKLVFGAPQEESPLGADRDAFLQCARSAMTAPEYLALFKGVPQRERSMEQRVDVALAAVAVAFQQRQPLAMLAAAQAYAQLDADITAAKGAGSSDGSSPDVSVCRACCALLLGNTPVALQLLGLARGGTRPPRQDVHEFVLERSPDADDMLPGVYALAQSWMQEAVLGSFRPTSQHEAPLPSTQRREQQEQQPVQLASWFGAWHVRAVILVLTIIHNMRQLLAACVAWLLHSRKQLQHASTKMATDTLQATAARAASSSSSSSRQRSRQQEEAAGASVAQAAQQPLQTQQQQQQQQQQQTLNKPQPLEEVATPAGGDVAGGSQAAAAAGTPVAAAAATAAASRSAPRAPERAKSPVVQRLEAARLHEQQLQQDLDASPATKAGASPAPQPRAASPAAAPAAALASEPAAVRHSPEAVAPAPSAAAGDASTAAVSRAAAAVQPQHQQQQQQQPVEVNAFAVAARHGQGGDADDVDEDDEEECEAAGSRDAALRARLQQQLMALESRMWDAAPARDWPRHLGAVALGAVLIGAAAACVLEARGGVGRGANTPAGHILTRIMALRDGA